VGAERVEVEGVWEEGPVEELPDAPRPRYCRTYARNRVAEALPEIVETFVQQAKKGSVPHARALAGWGGLDKGEVPPRIVRRRGKSLGQQLLEEMGEPPEA
jgi:hypothetical protein